MGEVTTTFDIDFEINKVLDIEGEEYTDDPDDRGGPTKWGWTEHEARAFGYTGDMRDLAKDKAHEMFFIRYWIQPKFNLVAELSTEIAAELFDTGVNMGQGTGVKFLQRALNVMNLGGKEFPDIAIDGGIGKMTLYCLKTFLAKRGRDGEETLLHMLNAQQSVKYMEIAENNASQEKFEYGWQLNRVTM
jgi:lysozyme family protein